MYVFGNLKVVLLFLDDVLFVFRGVLALSGYFRGLPRLPFGLVSTLTTPFSFDLDFSATTFAELLTRGSGLGLQLGEVETLHELVLSTSFSELSTDKGLLTEDEDMLVKLVCVGLEGLLSEEESNDCDGERGDCSLPVPRLILDPDGPSTGSCVSKSITSGLVLLLHTALVDRLLLQESIERCEHVGSTADSLFFPFDDDGDFFFPSRSDSWRALLMAASS